MSDETGSRWWACDLSMMRFGRRIRADSHYRLNLLKRKERLLTMRSVNMKRYFGPLRHLWFLPGMLLIALPLSGGTVRIYITNSAGDTVDVIDPVTDKVVQRIEGTEAPHDVNFSRDGNRV